MWETKWKYLVEWCRASLPATLRSFGFPLWLWFPLDVRLDKVRFSFSLLSRINHIPGCFFFSRRHQLTQRVRSVMWQIILVLRCSTWRFKCSAVSGGYEPIHPDIIACRWCRETLRGVFTNFLPQRRMFSTKLYTHRLNTNLFRRIQKK